MTNKTLNFIPADMEHFNAFIHRTDDCQHELIERTVYPLKADGTYDYSSPNAKNVKEPAWKHWGWMEVESLRWSRFRREHDELYKAGKKELAEKNISDCMAYDEEHSLIERVANSGGTTLVHLEVFGIKQDVIQHKTKLRTITLHYEKQIPLSDFEKKFIKKYTELHEHVYNSEKKLCGDIKLVHATIPELWEKIYVAKGKIDKATNQMYLPPPEMKGDFSAMQYFKVPEAAEQQKMLDDCNKYLQQFSEETGKLCERTDILDERVYADSDYGDHEAQSDPLFEEVEKMHDELFDNAKNYSIEPLSLYDDFEEFRGAWSDENKKTMAAWDDFIAHQNVLVDVYNALVATMQENNARWEKEAKEADNTANDDITGGETDDIREETIQRYESGTSVYFDIDDWHIILDNYEQKFDQNNKAIALEKAFTQHPENATLLLRKAQDEIGKHEYQKAMAFIKQAEEQGPPHHPNLYFIKADVYLQMHAPIQAVPIYNKIIEAKGVELEPFRERARFKLMDIYAEQKKYSECIELCKALLKSNPDDENVVASLSNYYLKSGMIKEAEETAESYVKKFPESTVCIEQLGNLYRETKDYDKAAKLFQDCFDLNPGENYRVLFDKGNLLMEMQRFGEAVVCFETCLFHYHLDKDYHLSAAKCYTELKMPYAARFHYHKAIEIDPDCLEAMNQLQQYRLNN